ncbi:MAG TPA: hypothetical protein VM409_07660, partial [Chloroflexia bacterium]|nr:hypothetical protein [Chloroflexia bacterium]
MGPIEKEFDPSEYPPEYLTVGKTEELQSILDRVEEAWIRTPNAVLVIPRGAHAFHTTHDFLALGKLQGVREVRVSIVSFDATIAGLASLLGFHIVELPEDHPALIEENAIEEPADPDERDIEKPTAPLPLTRSTENAEWVLSSTPIAHTPASLTTSAWLNNPGDPALYETGNVARGARNALPLPDTSPAKQARPGTPPPRTRPRQTGQLTPAIITGSASIPDEEELDSYTVSSTPSGRIKARRYMGSGSAYGGRQGLQVLWMKKPVPWSRAISIFTLVVLLALGSGAAYAYNYLPEGTISVTPLNQAYNSLPVEVSVITSPQSGRSTGLASAARQNSDKLSAPSLQAVMLKAPLAEEGDRAATGTREIAKGRAQGTMHFTNRTGAAVFVGAGLQFKGPNGVMVQTTQAGTVPATIFGQVFGTQDIPVAAMVEGPAGNIGAGQISGIYNGTLNYSNSSLQGGSTESVKVVKQEDIDTLVAELRSKAESRVGGAVLEVVGPGQQLITQTISLANVAFQADRKPGEDGQAVHVKLTGEARAYAFKDSDLRDSVAQAVLDW